MVKEKMFAKQFLKLPVQPGSLSCDDISDAIMTFLFDYDYDSHAYVS